jgi:hypothetical protein
MRTLTRLTLLSIIAASARLRRPVAGLGVAAATPRRYHGARPVIGRRAGLGCRR